MEERLKVHATMNRDLKKLADIHKKKAELADNLVKRCVDLEETNQKLLSFLSSHNPMQGPPGKVAPGDVHVLDQSVRGQSALN
jgi:hypothetical protein